MLTNKVNFRRSHCSDARNAENLAMALMLLEIMESEKFAYTKRTRNPENKKATPENGLSV